MLKNPCTHCILWSDEARVLKRKDVRRAALLRISDIFVLKFVNRNNEKIGNLKIDERASFKDQPRR